jgi:hypothetical protein
MISKSKRHVRILDLSPFSGINARNVHFDHNHSRIPPRTAITSLLTDDLRYYMQLLVTSGRIFHLPPMKAILSFLLSVPVSSHQSRNPHLPLFWLRITPRFSGNLSSLLIFTSFKDFKSEPDGSVLTPGPITPVSLLSALGESKSCHASARRTFTDTNQFQHRSTTFR